MKGNESDFLRHGTSFWLFPLYWLSASCSEMSGGVNFNVALPRRLSTKELHGFTLLELLVALAIMLIAVAGIMHAVSNGLVTMQSISRRMEALNLARMKMEELLQSPEEQPTEQEGDFGEAFPQFRWSARISDAPVEGLKTITVAVVWFEGAEERTLTLSVLYGREKLSSLLLSENELNPTAQGEHQSGAIRKTVPEGASEEDANR
ncbi:MAG: hypothetical protein RUDDFDWM_000356 [Candidatus Fervidibacterota bacterium]